MRNAGAVTTSGFDVAATDALTRSACARADLVLACSEVDADRIRSLTPRAHVEVVENGIAVDSFSAVSPLRREAPPIVTFTGLLGYWPNADACIYFVSAIWPRVLDRVQGAVFRMVGRVPPASVVELTRHRSVELHADVPDILPWFGASQIMVAPLRAGSGTRLKILEAFAAGRPVVSTSIGCEGLTVGNGEHLLIADRPEEFADRVAQLLTDAALRERLVAAARSLVHRRYDVPAVAAQLRAHYDALASAPRRSGQIPATRR
jgi:glycosyltransferase involved in cell wall biosynthesis